MNINALPEHARQNSAEQSSAVARQGQNMGQARMENIMRPDQVAQAQAQAQSGLIFRPLDGKTDAVANQKKTAEKEKARNKSEKYELYAPPRHGRKKNLSSAESTIDFTA